MTPLPTIGKGVGARAHTFELSSMSEELSAPFPWFGGKSAVADRVWDALGGVCTLITNCPVKPSPCRASRPGVRSTLTPRPTLRRMFPVSDLTPEMRARLRRH